MGQTLIEINGKRYNAVTGSIVGNSAPRNIDGINVVPQAGLPRLARPTAVVSKPARLMHDVTTQKRHIAQKSKTLMRHVVKKPGSPQVSSTNVSQNQRSQLSNASYIASISHSERLEKALKTPTHPTISRYQRQTHPAPTQPTIQHMPVVSHVHAAAVPMQTVDPASVAHQQPQTAKMFVDSQLAKAVSAPEKRQPKEKLSSKFKKAAMRRKTLSIAASMASVVAIAGFIAFQNMPTISLAIATNKAGLGMSTPKGIPSNFRLSSDIDYAPGMVTTTYNSVNDTRTFTLTQQKITEGTQESLEQAIALSAQGDYQTFNAKGLKLFIVGAGKADWIDGDMRYSLSGESGLSSEQLTTIATSL